MSKGVRVFSVGPPWRPDRSWGQPDPGNSGEVGSSPDDAGTCCYCQMVRVRLARPGCVTRVNQWLKPRKECPVPDDGVTVLEETSAVDFVQVGTDDYLEAREQWARESSRSVLEVLGLSTAREN